MQDDSKGQPIDKGWAWVILLASFMEHTLLFGARRTFGVLYKEFMVSYDASATEVALAMTVQTIVVSLVECGSHAYASFLIFLALLVLSIGTRFCSARVYVLVGGISAFAAHLMNSFATSVPLLIISQGFFFGFAHAFCHGPTLVTLGQYFKEKRGFATLLATIGHCIGSICFPPLVQFLLVNYGLQGCLLIMSGILLNFTVAGALLRPLSFYKRDGFAKECIKNETNDLGERKRIGETDDSLSNISTDDEESEDSKHYDPLCGTQDVKQIERERIYAVSHQMKQKKNDDLYSSATILDQNIQITGSLIDIIGSTHSLSHTTDKLWKDGKETNTAKTDDKKSSKVVIVRHLIHILHQLFDPKVIHNRKFRLFIIMVCFSVVGTTQVITFIPAHAEDQGISRQDIAVLLTITGSVDLLSKLLLAFISDRSFVRKHTLLAVAHITIGITVNFIHFFTDFKTMSILMVMYGIFGQAYNGLFPAILAEFVGVENLSSAMGIVVLTHGVMMSIASPIFGAIRDVTGSFDIGFHIMGACYFIGGTVLFAEPVFRKMEQRRLAQNDG